ncbi:MAG: DUF2635 domain-containing protein [Alphaproteobacteria bacterium]|nr:MAG: DUF2635 domain-containing protein [Alphaproteobacteria bacterium]
MYVKPAPGLDVPDTDKGGVLPPEGRFVDDHIYWLRRIETGEVVISEPPEQAAEEQSPAINPRRK